MKITNKTEYFVTFDKMCWPYISKDLHDLVWDLAHTNTTRGQNLIASTIISAYIELINSTQSKRNKVCKVLKVADVTEIT